MNHQAPLPPSPPALLAPMDDDLPSYPWAEPSPLASAQARRAHRLALNVQWVPPAVWMVPGQAIPKSHLTIVAQPS